MTTTTTYMMNGAIVDIVDVFADAVRIPVHAIVVSDKIFDVFGNTYDVVETKSGRTRIDGATSIWIKALNNPGSWCYIGDVDSDGVSDTITIIPTSRREA